MIDWEYQGQLVLKHLQKEKEYKNKYSKASVYYFKADLKKGENTINHSYSYRGATSTYDKGEYQYVLTTISKWKNKKLMILKLS